MLSWPTVVNSELTQHHQQRTGTKDGLALLLYLYEWQPRLPETRHDAGGPRHAVRGGGARNRPSRPASPRDAVPVWCLPIKSVVPRHAAQRSVKSRRAAREWEEKISLTIDVTEVGEYVRDPGPHSRPRRSHSQRPAGRYTRRATVCVKEYQRPAAGFAVLSSAACAHAQSR